ncbi:hypothetical protein RF55_13784 [Lasius niger]|uniref:Uncharacterized protein n=1 Tax=Lasius niger TaxID=67767 RepID=A0A0J7K9V4_LASNI|nr:hypothetical protein RF55_13784 [Lasius niger]
MEGKRSESQKADPALEVPKDEEPLPASQIPEMAKTEEVCTTMEIGPDQETATPSQEAMEQSQSDPNPESESLRRGEPSVSPTVGILSDDNELGTPFRGTCDREERTRRATRSTLSLGGSKCLVTKRGAYACTEDIDGEYLRLNLGISNRRSGHNLTLKPEASTSLTSDPSSRSEVRDMEEAALTQRSVPTTEEPEMDPGKPETGDAAVQPECRPTQSAEERTTESGKETVPAASQEASE